MGIQVPHTTTAADDQHGLYAGWKVETPLARNEVQGLSPQTLASHSSAARVGRRARL